MDALRKTLLAEGGRDGFDSYRVPGWPLRQRAPCWPAARAG